MAALKAGTLSPAGLIDQASVVPGLLNHAVIRLIPEGMGGTVLTALAPADAVRVVTTIAPSVSESALLAACASLWQHLGRRLLRETAFLAGGDITAVAGALRSSYVNSDPNARAYAIQQILPLVPADVALALQQLAGTVTVGDLSAAIDAAERHAATTDDISLACRVVELVALDNRTTSTCSRPAGSSPTDGWTDSLGYSWRTGWPRRIRKRSAVSTLCAGAAC